MWGCTITLTNSIHIDDQHENVFLIDLDGVLADYSEGWKGYDHVGKLLPHAKEFVTKLYKDGNKIIIFSVRAGTQQGVDAITKFLTKYKIPYHSISNVKVPGIIIDDNCYRFEGWNNVFMKKITSK